MPEDFDLLAAWRGGDRDAGEALFDRHFSSISRFFRNKVTTGVDDLVQKTFLGLVESRDSFRGHSSFRTFLFAIAHNVLSKHYRTRSRNKMDLESVSAADLAPGQSSLMAKKLEHRLLAQALRTIPLQYQMLLELQYWESLSTSEIAEVLGVPQGTAKTRLRKAKAVLREAVEQLADSPELRASTLEGLDGWARELRELATGARPTTGLD